MLRRTLLALVILITIGLGALGSAAHLDVDGGTLQVFELPVQIDLPEPDLEGCFAVTLEGVEPQGDGRSTLSLKVANSCKYDVSYVAIGSAGAARVAPVGGETHRGTLGLYDVTWTGGPGLPGFESIKFEPRFEGYSRGAVEMFRVTLSGLDAITSLAVQVKAGGVTGTYEVAFEAPDVLRAIESTRIEAELSARGERRSPRAVARGEVLVRNPGAHATAGLRIVLQLQAASGDGGYGNVSGSRQEIQPTDLEAGADLRLPYEIAFDPVVGASYRVVARAYIRNHEEHVGEEYGPTAMAAVDLPAEEEEATPTATATAKATLTITPSPSATPVESPTPVPSATPTPADESDPPGAPPPDEPTATPPPEGDPSPTPGVDPDPEPSVAATPAEAPPTQAPPTPPPPGEGEDEG
jgi:hypothetical protein